MKNIDIQKLFSIFLAKSRSFSRKSTNIIIPPQFPKTSDPNFGARRTRGYRTIELGFGWKYDQKRWRFPARTSGSGLAH